MKSSIFALTFALALIQVSSAQESVDPTDVTPISDPVFPSPTQVWEDPSPTEDPEASASPVWVDPFLSAAPRPSGSGVPQYSGSVRPPRTSGSGVNPSASKQPPIPTVSGMPPQPSGSTKSRSRPHRTTFSEGLPPVTEQPSDGAYPTGL
ncbi:hypothetical protein BGZ72_003956 [Mortierella alpina]|nr:hypothetical protein BGZ72_003956 [Mortierella alpina]